MKSYIRLFSLIAINLLVSVSYAVVPKQVKPAGRSVLNDIPGPLVVEYLPTWNYDLSDNPEKIKSALGHIPSYVNVINLSFIDPQMSYSGADDDLSATGLGFDPATLRNVMSFLRSTHPNVKILAAVGGYQAKWYLFNPKAIGKFVADYGLDGVDIDYEPAFVLCATHTSKIAEDSAHCRVDFAFIDFIKKLREAVPRPKAVSIAGWSSGAFGITGYEHEPEFSNIFFLRFKGEFINIIKEAGADLDLINIMAYNNGPKYDPLRALTAYQTLFGGLLTVGMQIPPEVYGHVLTEDEVHRIDKGVQDLHGNGVMVWPTSPDGKKHIDLQTTENAICRDFKLTPCKN